MVTPIEMAPDEKHDRFVPKGPKHPTPTGLPARGGTQPRGVPQFSSSPTVDATETAHELARRERENFGGDTPVDAPASVVLDRIAARTRVSAETTSDIKGRMLVAESQLGEMNSAIRSLATDVATLNGSVQTLVGEIREQRAERLERERRQETRAEAEAARAERERQAEREAKKARTRQILGIWVPTIAAIGAGIAGIIAATRAPDVKYMPAPAPAAEHSKVTP